MNDDPDYKSANAAPCQYPSTHSCDFVKSVAQDEGLGVCAISDQATNVVLVSHTTPQKTTMPHPETHPGLSRAGGSACASKSDKETYGEDTEQITEKIIEPASGEVTTFEVALQARYERLSLLTLDLATEAGESVRELSYGERRKEPKQFDRSIASMTKAVWAHRVIEKLRTGEKINTEDLAGLLPDLSYPPSHHLSTHSSDFVTSVAQDKGMGSGTTGEISSHPATSQESQSPTPEHHPEPTRSAVSTDIGQAACDKCTEIKKEKNEIEQNALTPQSRKKEANSNNIQPIGEMCGVSVTQTGESHERLTTHTDKMSLSLREAGAQSHKIPIDAEPARSPP